MPTHYIVRVPIGCACYDVGRESNYGLRVISRNFPDGQVLSIKRDHMLTWSLVRKQPVLVVGTRAADLQRGLIHKGNYAPFRYQKLVARGTARLVVGFVLVH
jgi:hypothetical protein